ncbi:hypothetical protein [Streptococcus equinus]|uniref:hypothetical protein n=1 Tax=Streptococcus equinus TaxID=1335 RepID=UPI0015F77AB1|nr:hypothetical protein [Streptococcus equinus]QMS96479.1 hypothetical protein H1R75_00910 [Streptococcus equinus]
MNLTERAEIRKETYYKLTNSATAPTVLSTNAQNLLLNSPVNADNLRRFGASKATISVVTRDNRQAYKLTVNTSGDSGAMFNGNAGYYNLIKDRLYTFSFYALTNIDKSYSFNSLGHIQAINEHGDIVGSDKLHQHSNPVYSTNTIKANSWTKVWCTFKATSTSYFKPYFWYLRAGDEIYINNMMLNEGDTPLPYVPAPEDYGWSKDTLVPTQSNRYLWKFEYIYYSDGSVENTQPVNISIAGADGTNGQTSHVHFAFADNATGGGFSLTTPKAYMGWYADFNETASTDPTKYRWSKWKGDQGLPGKPGADGKTSYFHMAYADSADGRTGFSFKESGQQYQGYYTDFTQSSSTDPTKYTWMDRRAGVEVSGRNLWIQSKAAGGFVEETLPDNHVTGQKKCYRIPNNNELAFNIEPDFSSRLYRKVTFSAWVKYENVVQGTNNWNVFNCFKHTLYLKNSSTGATSTANYLTLGGFVGTSDWKYITYTYDYAAIKSYDQLKTTIRFNLEGAKSGTAWVTGVMVQFGNVATGHVWAPEDIQADIDSKADQTLTQEQLNALEAKRLQMETEMKALATLQQVSELETFINNLKKEDLDGRQKIIEITKAIEERVKDIEPIMEYSQKLKFMDTYITQGNGGMIIGKNDSSTKVVVTPDRISFQSGGSEVAYISQSMLHIDNGVFTMSLQLGHYITRAHPRNEYVNATYFVK